VKFVRLLVFILATILLAGGYLVSQIAYVKSIGEKGKTPVVVYAERIDVPVIVLASVIVVVGCVIFTVFQEPKEDGSD